MGLVEILRDDFWDLTSEETKVQGERSVFHQRIQ